MVKFNEASSSMYENPNKTALESHFSHQLASVPSHVSRIKSFSKPKDHVMIYSKGPSDELRFLKGSAKVRSATETSSRYGSKNFHHVTTHFSLGKNQYLHTSKSSGTHFISSTREGIKHLHSMMNK
jgi:hypothetical protein